MINRRAFIGALFAIPGLWRPKDAAPQYVKDWVRMNLDDAVRRELNPIFIGQAQRRFFESDEPVHFYGGHRGGAAQAVILRHKR